MIAATCGNLYRHLIGNVHEYPIPEIRLPPGEGRTFLEVGCNWGRWCVSAARRGYRVVGVDPSLDAIRAARRVAEQLDVEAKYVVADARHLPFADGPSTSSSRTASSSTSRSTTRSPRSPSSAACSPRAGARSCRWRTSGARRPREPGARAALPRAADALRRPLLEPGRAARRVRARVGPTELAVDGFLTLNPQPADLELLPRRYRALVQASEALRRVSRRPPLTRGRQRLRTIAAWEPLDLVGAGLGLVVTSPLLAVAALAIKLEDRGPVLYRQRRVGLGGDEFELLKLRTMVVGAERRGGLRRRPRRRADHARRPSPPPALGRRAAAALERAPRRDEPDRPAADARLPGRALHAAPAAPARRQARAHRVGADPRPRRAAVGRADRARRLVRRAPLAARRPEDPRATPLALFAGTYKGATGGWREERGH